MIIYPQETDDGLSEKLSSQASISYASVLTPCYLKEQNKIKNNTTFAALNDSDLYYVQSILVSSSWNKNDDIFDKAEVWAARSTPEDKPTNLEHDESVIIGHITSNWSIDEDGNILEDSLIAEELPEKFHIVTGSVIYKSYTKPELKERAEKLISEIENGTKYVSMECYFKGFDYGLVSKSSGQYKILSRNNDTAYLTKYLKAYGGQGEHEDYKIGRVLRNITFSGKGFVDKPANPESIIFNKSVITDLVNKKNDNLSKSGVIENKPTINADTENMIMSENIEKQVAEINEKLDTVSASCADQVSEAKAFASELQETNKQLEAAMKEKEEMVNKEKTKSEEIAAEFDAAAKKYEEEKARMEEEMKKVKSELDEAAAAMTNKDEELKKVKSELDQANEVIAGYKMKEEEMARKEKMMNRKATLVEAGLEDDDASAAVEKFEALDDETFEAMAVMMKKKAAVKPTEEAVMKKMASEDEAEAALEEVEAEETIDLSVGNDESESAEASVRSELVEFVSARLGKNSK